MRYKYNYLFLNYHYLKKILFKDNNVSKLIHLPELKISNEEDASKDENIYCRNCISKITNVNYKIIINGSFSHIFKNPAGLEFEIGCFSKADGCFVYGIPTLEYTWFKDYKWNYALCRKCNMHLGWFYQTNAHNFFGLILDRLIIRKI